MSDPSSGTESQRAGKLGGELVRLDRRQAVAERVEDAAAARSAVFRSMRPTFS
jgi:hypothetical protein